MSVQFSNKAEPSSVMCGTSPCAGDLKGRDIGCLDILAILKESGELSPGNAAWVDHFENMSVQEREKLEVVSPDSAALLAVAPPTQTAYMIAGGRAFFVYDAARGLGTLTMRVAQRNYVKLRNIRMVPADAPRENDQEWLPIGSPVAFFLRREDLAMADIQHQDNARFPVLSTKLAIVGFLRNCSQEIREVASLGKKSPYKLTTEMSWDGKLRVVMKRLVGSGGTKLVFKDRIVFQEDSPSEALQTIARGKIKQEVFERKLDPGERVQDDREDKELQAGLQKEADWSALFRQKGARYIPTMHIAPSQNLKKVRLDMDFVDGGDLFEILTEGCSWTRRERLEYLRQIAETVQVIHDNGYTYNDLKPENCLYDRATKEARLGDLDFIDPIGAKKVSGGTYPAPEVYLRQKEDVSTEETKKNDSWGLGLILYALLHDVRVFPDFNWAHPVAKIQEAQKALVGGLSARDPADKLIIDLLAMDPGHRPSMKEVVCRLTQMLAELPGSSL